MLFFSECPGFHVKRSKLCVEEKLKACGKKKSVGKKMPLISVPVKNVLIATVTYLPLRVV